MGISDRRIREKQARKTAILDAARSALLDRGFEKTTTKYVATQCELAEATLFFYFKNKDEILSSLLFEGIEFWTKGLEEIEILDMQPKDKLAKIWGLFQAIQREHPEYTMISAYLARPNGLNGVSDEVTESIVHLSGLNFIRLANLLEAITGRSDGRTMADTLWSTFLGLMTLAGSRKNLLPNYDVKQTHSDAVFEILSAGLLAEKE